MAAIKDDRILTEMVKDFAEKHHEENFYMLRTNIAQFGFLYVGTGVCTLGWQGSLMFSRLDAEVLTELPSLITGIRISYQQTDKVSVSLVLEASKLVEYDLTNESCYNEYMDDMHRPDRISFVRYDAEYLPSPFRREQLLKPIQYAFTAENPQWPSFESELTIQLPRFERWPESLLDWSKRHHLDGHISQYPLDLTAFSSTIDELTHSNQPA